jgi:hypothetical protein
MLSVMTASMTVLPACKGSVPEENSKIDDLASGQAGAKPVANLRPLSDADQVTESSAKNYSVNSLELNGYKHVMSIASITCEDGERGLGCTMGNPANGDSFDVKLYRGCGEEGLFAGVIANPGSYIYEKYPPKSGIWPAYFERGQFLCVLAEAGDSGDAYMYYVVEVPTQSVADCKESDLCKSYGNRAVKWNVPQTGQACHASGENQFEGMCAKGWIEAEKVEVFTMGLVPEPDYKSR